MSDAAQPGETNPQRPERKLAAIFSADVQGYSRLMSDDELMPCDLGGRSCGHDGLLRSKHEGSRWEIASQRPVRSV